MLESRGIDRAKVNDCLDEVQSLIRQLRGGWKPDPPRAVFDQMAATAERLLGHVIQHKPQVAADGYDKRLAAFRDEAEKALSGENAAAWKETCQKVSKLCSDLEGMLEKDSGASGPQDPNVLLLSLAQRLRELADKAKTQGRYEKLKKEFKEAGDSLKRIVPTAADAMIQIRDWYFTRLQSLEKRVEAPEDTGLLEAGGTTQ
jgi:hypothetical protein